jgi:hypothetical protein
MIALYHTLFNYFFSTPKMDLHMSKLKLIKLSM